MKKIYYIIIFIVVFSSGSFAQSKTSLAGDPSAKIIRFYPNPAVSIINFEFPKGIDKSSSLQIYNFIGKKVFDSQTAAQKINISLTDFYRGVYIYQLRDRTGKIIESGKFQVVK
ncbi:MAG: T9SS type A sorting domain-containing protein [Bacteroidota bacterium]|nr:T9SS type A sorting domain-containing protein [Bacteroidota bacterium]